MVVVHYNVSAVCVGGMLTVISAGTLSRSSR
jgi:hypothetical protein